MVFKLFKKNKSDVPPDVGQEEIYDQKNKKEPEPVEEPEEEPIEEKPVIKKTYQENDTVKELNSQLTNLEFEKVNTKIESLTALIKGYGERMSLTNQQIGEVRAMCLANEKSVSKIEANADRAIDIVKEVKPEKLRTDYQRLELKIQEVKELIDTNKQYNDSIMNELKDFRRRLGMFVGTDALLKLNDEVKQDLIATQQLAAKTRMHADKSEQLFMEIRRGFAESQKALEMINNLDKTYSGIDKEVKNLKMDISNILSLNEFNDFKKYINNKLTEFEKILIEVSRVKQDNENLKKIIETTVKIAKQNQEDIGDIGVAIGDDHIKKVRDYETKVSSILEVLDKLAEEIKKIKGNIGMEHKNKLEVKKKTGLLSKKIKLKHIKLHPKAETTLTKPISISKSMKKLHKKSLKNKKLIMKLKKKSKKERKK